MACEELYSNYNTYEEISGNAFRGPIYIGDLSLKGGGLWYPDHPGRTHQNGLNADIRYIRKNRKDAPLDIVKTPDEYDSKATHNMILAFKEVFDEIELILVHNKDVLGFDVNDDDGNSILTYDDDGHTDHFHIRVKCPDGQCQ